MGGEPLIPDQIDVCHGACQDCALVGCHVCNECQRDRRRQLISRLTEMTRERDALKVRYESLGREYMRSMLESGDVAEEEIDAIEAEIKAARGAKEK